MRNRFDQLAKQLGREALGPSGTTIANDEISPETQQADLRHEPDPLRQHERARLGLLGRFAAIPCLIEIYGRAPSAEEFRACLAKHLAFWRQRTRKARADDKRQDDSQRLAHAIAEPFLWIVAAGTPVSILTEIAAVAAPGWPAGVYLFDGEVLRVGIVAASELPRDRSTLLVRLMAAGPLLPRAIEDLIALAPDAYERVVAEQILLQLQHALTRRSHRTPEEEEFIMAMHKGWEELRTESIAAGRAEGIAAGRAEGIAAGRAEGIAAGQAEAVLTVLRARGIAVSDAARARILAENNVTRLKRWVEKAIVVSSIDDLIDDPR